jgi:hypothetical protein
MRNAYKVLVRKLERKRSPRRHRRRWKDTIRMDVIKNMMESCGLDASGSG